MRKIQTKFFVVFCTSLLILSTLIVGVGAFRTSEGAEKNIVQVRISDGTDLSELNRLDIEILERYESFVLIESDQETIEDIEDTGMEVNRLPNRTQIAVKGHIFDIEDGPDLDPDLMVDGYKEGAEGLHMVHMLGPVHPEWRFTLEEKGVEIINYVPNHAYEVSMTPETAEEVRELDFVDWVGIYHPEFKLHSRLDEALEEDLSVNLRLRPGFERSSLLEVESKFEVHSFEDLREDGYRLVVDVDSVEQLEDVANMNDVYFISPYVEPELHGEMDSQLIGGGAWFMDDEYLHSGGDHREGDPDQPYRKHGDHGAYINQVGYTGKNVTITPADTGIGNGTVGDAGHPDLTGRVVGGYSFRGDWHDGHGHGTHVAGSAAGDTYGGTGETFDFGDYYMGQGLAYESELFATQIFDADGSFLPREYYPIVEEPAQRSDAYIHSNSWGGMRGGTYESFDETFDQTVRDADREKEKNRPMVITSSVGNYGTRGDRSITSPGNAKNVIGVGATHTYNPDDFFGNAEIVSDFSSRGWTQDNRVKPDVVAPGEGIYSLDLEGGYKEMSGTSMSTPAVAGAASVVVEWYEENYGKTPSPAMVRSILINTATDLDPEVGNTRGHIPNRDEGWGIVDISKLEYPKEQPLGFRTADQETLLETGEIQRYPIVPADYSEPLKVTLTWTDQHARDGDSIGGIPTLKNNLDLEVETPSGEVIRGNAFDLSGDGDSDDGFTYPEAEVMADFDFNEDGWDDRNNVQNIYIHPDDVEPGPYEVRVKGTEIPADSNNDGIPNQDFALTAHNAEASSDGRIDIEEYRYSTEDTVELKVRDGDLGDRVEIDVGIHSDTDPTGFNVTLYGEKERFRFTGEVEVSDTGEAETLEVSHGDTITAEYWDEDTGDGTGAMKRDTAYIDGLPPKPPTQLDVEWWGEEEVEIWHDNVSEDLGYYTGRSGRGASEWEIRDHGSVLGNYSWDWGDKEYATPSIQGYLSYLISPELEIPEVDEEVIRYEFTFQHWRDFRGLIDGGNLKLSTTGIDGEFEVIEPKEGYDGIIDDRGDNPIGGEQGWTGTELWETVTFDLTEYAGESVHLRWDAGTSDIFSEGGEGWRLDDLTLTKIEQAEDDNLLTWTASDHDQSSAPDNPNGHVSRYDIYRAEEMDGPWDETNLINSVLADRSEHYSYVDEDRGDADDERWWYVIRAVKDVGNMEMNEMVVPEPEPGAPYVSILSPEEDTIIKGEEVSVEWEGAEEIDNYEVRLNDGDRIDLGTTTEHTFENVSGGDHMISIFGCDDATGDVGYDSVSFVVDLTPPVLDITYPEDEGYVNESAVIVEWEGDAKSGIDHYEVRINDGDWIDVNKDTSFTLEDLEHSETHIIQVKATDRAERETTKSVTFTVDLVSPDIEIIFPEDEGWGSTNMTAEWHGEDELSGINNYEVRIDEGEWIEVGDVTEHEFTDLSIEEHVLEVRAWDQAGNFNMATSTFNIDPEPPQIEIVSPAENDIFDSDKVSLFWNMGDEYSGLSHIEVRLDELDEDEWIDVGMSSRYTFTDLEDGSHTGLVRATNNARKHSYDQVTFTVDTTPPQLSIIYPERDAAYDEEDVTVKWDGEDYTSGIEFYEVRIDKSEWMDVGLDTSYTFEGLDEGYHSVEVRAWDTAGNNNIDKVRFAIDMSPPQITLLSPEDNELIPTDEIVVSWNSNDGLSGVSYHEIRLDEDDWIEVGTSSLYTLKGVEDGDHTVEVRAIDEAGNSDQDEVSFTVDTTPPELDITSPEAGAIYAEDEVTVKWEGSDETSGLDLYEVRIDDGDWLDAGLDESHVFEGLEDGEHLVEVRGKDAAGHTSVESVEFTIDTTPPEVRILSPQDGEFLAEDEVNVTWSGSDEISGIDTFKVRLDDGQWTEVGDVTQYTLDGLSDGGYIVEVMAQDEAGNTETMGHEFTVDTTPPELSITSPDEGETVDGDEVTVKWEGSDEVSGVSSYEVRLNQNEWIDVGSDTEYTFEDVYEGDSTVEIRAVDGAGNERIEELSFTVDEGIPLYWWMILGLVILGLVVLLVMKVRKEGNSELEEDSLSNQGTKDHISQEDKEKEDTEEEEKKMKDEQLDGEEKEEPEVLNWDAELDAVEGLVFLRKKTMSNNLNNGGKMI